MITLDEAIKFEEYMIEKGLDALGCSSCKEGHIQMLTMLKQFKKCTIPQKADCYTNDSNKGDKE